MSNDPYKRPTHTESAATEAAATKVPANTGKGRNPANPELPVDTLPRNPERHPSA
jgi:hypothetical protein